MSWWQNLLVQFALAGIQIFNQRFGGSKTTSIAVGTGAAQVAMAHVAKRSNPET